MRAAQGVSESEWLAAVGDALDFHRWWWYHARPARRAHGKWTTPGQGSGSRGWPDIFAVRDGRALALELKTAAGRVTPEQTDWLARLRAAGVEARLIRLPKDWEAFLALTRPDPKQMTLTSNNTAADRRGR